MRVYALLLILSLAGCSHFNQDTVSRPPEPNAAFHVIADDYIAGYLAWRPQAGTSLGLHQYDGKVTDYSKASLDAELARLKSVDEKLGDMNEARLTPQNACDYRILRNAVRH